MAADATPAADAAGASARARAPAVAMAMAMDRNRLIGSDGGMPWHVPGEQRHFRHVTTGKPIVMGRRTHESIGRPLPERTNIVVTRDRGWRADGVVVAHSLEEAPRHRTARRDGERYPRRRARDHRRRGALP